MAEDQQGLTEKFNELSQLNAVYPGWGMAAREALPEAAQDALVTALTANNNEHMTFSALDYGPYQKALIEGPEAVGGLEKACELVEKFLHQADYNMSVLLPFMKAADAKAAVPAVEDAAEVKKLCTKYALTHMGGLL